MNQKFEEKLIALAAEYEDNARSIRKTLALMNGHQKERAIVALPQKLATAKRIMHRKSSSAKGRVFKLTVPKRMTFKQRKGLVSYLLYQIGTAADGPFSQDDIKASFAAINQGFNGQAVGSAFRYGYIKKAPSWTQRNKVYELIVNKPPAVFANLLD